MKGSRVSVIAAAVAAGICLLYAMTSAVMLFVAPSVRVTHINVDVTVMIVLASFGIAFFLLSLILRSVSK